MKDFENKIYPKKYISSYFCLSVSQITLVWECLVESKVINKTVGYYNTKLNFGSVDVEHTL